MKTLRLILGDQLNIKHSWFKEINQDVVYCLFEMKQETDYVRHHIQKVIGFLKLCEVSQNIYRRQVIKLTILK
jgi:deoxyribodipyrimidine photolyase-related protein